MGVHSGEPTLGGERYVGMVVHRAARICGAASGGQVLLSSATRELIADDLPEPFSLHDCGEHRLKDIDQPERLFQLVGDGLVKATPPRATAVAQSPERGQGELAGRDEEQARIGTFLDAARAAPRALLIEGEPGIGKTSLWRTTVDDARARGFRLLTARPAEAEASLSFSALGDLLADATPAIAGLPEPQRRALRVALLLEDAEGRTDARALAVALLGLLRRLAEDGPLLVAVDDVQWLDPATAGALAFALRRLETEPAGFLGAARPGSTSFDVDGMERLIVGPLDLSALDRIVRSIHGARLSRPQLHRLEQVSGGNPFYAIELAAALLRREDAKVVPAGIPLPERLTDLVRERLHALPKPARDALLTVAALSAPTPDLVAAATGSQDALDAAVEARVLVLEGDRVRLHHPLLGSVAYADAPTARRRELHLRLAELVSGPEDRARHLASAAKGPDEAVASELEDAARGARMRGAAESAAELAELAVELTPDETGDAVVRRRALAGDCYFAAGDARRAAILLDVVVRDLPPGPERARALWRLAAVKAAVEGPPVAFPLYEQALAEAGDDVRLQAQIHDRLATWVWINQGARAAEPHTRALLELAERIGEPGLLARALGAQLTIELGQGRELDEERYARMLALEQEAPAASVEVPGSTLHHQLLAWASSYEEARARIEVFLERARQRSEASQILPLWCSGYVDALTAHWHDALAAVEQGLELVEQVGRDALVPGYLSLRGLVYAHLGEEERARADATLAIDLAARSGQEIHALTARGALAVLDLSLGDTRSAYERWLEIGAAVDRRGDHGIADWWLADELESRIAEGELDEVEARLERYHIDSKRSRRVRFVASQARVRALLADARGDADRALELFREALQHHERFDDEYQLGRTLLALGSVQRRLSRKADARESLSRALGHFEAVGARLWADRARKELGRLGGRPSRAGDLTGTEEQIAVLVASGKTNAEVAKQLHVSPKTVEWNLSKIYRKLGVSSRTELAAKLSRRPS
jgi:DNA-binding CsgD family transcriptional regulator